MFKGIPNEIYTYGTQMFVTIIGIGIGVLISGEIWIPILYRLKVVSIYEYFELRYKSKFPRRLMTAIFILKVNV
jgi:Na+/proline symporter